jgi:hypothetical protein
VVAGARANDATALKCSGLNFGAGAGVGAGVCEKAVTPMQKITNNNPITLFVISSLSLRKRMPLIRLNVALVLSKTTWPTASELVPGS